MRFSCDVCLLPFNYPIRLAEDLAVLDNLSGGRVEMGVGMGYAAHEFRGFGFPQSRRLSLTDEGLEVLTRAFTGEKFSFTGKRSQFQDVKITPGYVQPGGPPLWVATLAQPRAARAARFNTNLLPQGPRSQALDPWRKAPTDSGRDPADYRVGIIKSCLVTDDPERDWPAVREGERRRMAVYNQLRAVSGGHGGVSGITEEARIAQTWVCWQCRALRRGTRGLHPGIRAEGYRHLGGAAGDAAGPDSPQPGAFRARCRAPIAGIVSRIAAPTTRLGRGQPRCYSNAQIYLWLQKTTLDFRLGFSEVRNRLGAVQR